MFLKKAPALKSLFNKFAAATLLKIDPNSVFLWNFQEHLFWRTTANDCFWQYSSFLINLYMMNAFPIRFMACMMNVFLNRLFYPIVYRKADQWYFEWQQMATSGNEWQQVVQRMTARAKERQRVAQRVTTSGTASDNDWQRVTTSNTKW